MQITDDESSRDFDLRSITRGFLPVSPTYSIVSTEKGTANLLVDGHTVRFTPDKNFKGLASFKYTVKGNDKTEYTGRVEVLVEKGETEPDETPSDSGTTRLLVPHREQIATPIDIYRVDGKKVGGMFGVPDATTRKLKNGKCAKGVR